MTSAEYAAWAQFGAGLLTFFAAAFAVKASYDAPQKAAEFAEKLRKDNSSFETSRKLKFDLLIELMKHRGKNFFQDAAPALNLIELVFVDAPKVREAWHQFYLAIANDGTTHELRRERYNHIVEAIIQYLGLGTEINSVQIQASYFPDILQLKNEVELAHLRKQWADFYDENGHWKNPPGDKLRNAPPPVIKENVNIIKS